MPLNRILPRLYKSLIIMVWWLGVWTHSVCSRDSLICVDEIAHPHTSLHFDDLSRIVSISPAPRGVTASGIDIERLDGWLTDQHVAAALTELWQWRLVCAVEARFDHDFVVF
jgi:hypothetical protein